MDNTKTIRVLTSTEADLLIRDRAAAYVEEHGSDHTIEEFPVWADQLSADVGVELDHDYLADVVFHMECVASVENETHPDISHYRNGTLDNSGLLKDWEAGQLAKVMQHLLTLAYTPALERAA